MNGRLPARAHRRARAVDAGQGIPPQLDEIVLRATDQDPAGRPLDAGAFVGRAAQHP